MSNIAVALVDQLSIPDHRRITDLANQARRVFFEENIWPEPPDLTPGDVRIVLRAWAESRGGTE